MDEKYKAKKTNPENILEDPVEAKEAQTERNEQNTQDTLKTAISVGKKIPGVNVYAHAADFVDKATGGGLTKVGAKVANKGIQNMPMGGQVQNTINQVNESGLNSAVNKVSNVKSGNASGTKQNNNKGFGSGVKSSSGGIGDIGKMFGKGVSKFGGMKFKLILIGGGVAFFSLLLLVTVFADQNEINLNLTNNTQMSSSSIGVRRCTQEEVHDKLLYVGDNRINGIQSANIGTNVEYLTDSSGGYDWLNNVAVSEIENKINLKNDIVIVLSLGINDLNNIDHYVNLYRKLIEKYPKNIYIMSVNPIDESIYNNFTNNDIEHFNKKLNDNFPNNYIDSYSNLNNIVTSDGVHYDDATNNSIFNLITNSLMNFDSIVCSSGTVSNIDNSSFSGGSGSLLKTDKTLVSLIGQEKIDEWNALIANNVNAAGKGTGKAVAGTAYDLIQGALNMGYVLPYFWGGGHGTISNGVNGNWGGFSTVGAGGSTKQPLGSKHSLGLDCSGFVSWALKNGGCDNFTPIVAADFVGLGPSINPSDAVIGDIAANSSHVVLIIGNDGSNITVAEAKGANSGIVFSKFDYSSLGKYTVVSMSDYYANNCQG